MAITDKEFILDDPASYDGTTYKYHVGWVIETKQGRAFHSSIVEIKLEILTAEDLRYLQDKLFALQEKGTKSLIILGFSRLQK